MAKLPDNPNTRLERYLARLAGQDVSIPDTPITRIECYLAYLIKNGGGAAAPNAGGHNAVFRGKSLGSSFTEAQADAIDAGTFEDMFIGDYWTIGEMNYRIAGFDIFYKMSNPDITKHHAIVVPDRTLYMHPMNETDDTSTGYGGSLMKTQGLTQAASIVKEAFGDTHVIPHGIMVSIAAYGAPSGRGWVTSDVDLMTEGHLMGRGSWGTQNQNGFNVGLSYSQFPLFILAPQHIIANSSFWLQDVRNATAFAFMNSRGNSDMGPASNTYGVRPYFLLGKAS